MFYKADVYKATKLRLSCPKLFFFVLPPSNIYFSIGVWTLLHTFPLSISRSLILGLFFSFLPLFLFFFFRFFSSCYLYTRTSPMSSLLLAVPRPKKPLKNKSGNPEASHLLYHLVSLSAQTSLGNSVRPKMESNLRIPLTYILAHTKPGDVVVDLFGGTLSTAQACLRTDRRIYVLKKLFVLSRPKKFWTCSYSHCFLIYRVANLTSSASSMPCSAWS